MIQSLSSENKSYKRHDDNADIFKSKIMPVTSRDKSTARDRLINNNNNLWVYYKIIHNVLYRSYTYHTYDSECICSSFIIIIIVCVTNFRST